ncbi:MAG TPA: YbhB/YbcL family Raf kinase inhibitor-like protein [Stellaceae bacterium]|jgi:Raf kinase inhibitor-like YbhB/YbcL family protein|nr:YbhB/YbcL family Raf kinase inhibitor-like protein [Stellaceae bacterium]
MGKMTVIAAIAALGFFTAGTAEAMTLSSPDIKNGATIKDEHVLNSFGCTGKNISPAVQWSGAPAGTKSFALTIYDPDAPTGSGWWHWVVFNIPSSTTHLPENAGDPKANLMPQGAVQGRTDFGTAGFGGPCPPKGDKPHHYIMTLYALDVDHLDADANASAAYVGYNIHFHTLAKATLTGRYGRPK